MISAQNPENENDDFLSKIPNYTYIKEKNLSSNPLYTRRLIDCLSSLSGIKSREEISINCYNILADKFFLRRVYGSLPEHSSFLYRAQNILSELEFYQTDFLCLQEVDNYENFYKEKMEKLGYTTLFKEKARKGRYFFFSGVGSVLAYKSEKYELIEHMELIYDNFCSDLDNTGIEGIIGLFKSKKSGKNFLVATTHTHWSSDHDFIQFGQLACLMTKIKEILGRRKQMDIPIFVSGDFNVHRYSNVLRYMRQLPPILQEYSRPFYRLCKQPIEKVKSIWERFPNEFKMRSAYQFYERYKEKNFEVSLDGDDSTFDYYPEYTHYHKYHKGVIDFIFYNEKAVLKSIREMPSRSDLGLLTPNKEYSSDHLRIEAAFLI